MIQNTSFKNYFYILGALFVLFSLVFVKISVLAEEQQVCGCDLDLQGVRTTSGVETMCSAEDNVIIPLGDKVGQVGVTRMSGCPGATIAKLDELNGGAIPLDNILDGETVVTQGNCASFSTKEAYISNIDSSFYRGLYLNCGLSQITLTPSTPLESFSFPSLPVEPTSPGNIDNTGVCNCTMNIRGAEDGSVPLRHCVYYRDPRPVPKTVSVGEEISFLPEFISIINLDQLAKEGSGLYYFSCAGVLSENDLPHFAGLSHIPTLENMCPAGLRAFSSGYVVEVACGFQVPAAPPPVPETTAPNPFTIPSASELNKFGSQSRQQVIGSVIKLAMGVVGSLALVMFIYAGFLWMTAAGGAEKTSKAFKVMLWTSMGVILLFSSYAIINFVFGVF